VRRKKSNDISREQYHEDRIDPNVRPAAAHQLFQHFETPQKPGQRILFLFDAAPNSRASRLV
jgi:hypothetical protein